MFETEIKENLECKSRFIVDLENCKFKIVINKNYEENAQEIVEKTLEERREQINSLAKEWKEKEIEKVINWYVSKEEKNIYLIKRAYWLDYGQMKLRHTDFGHILYLNPYIKEENIADELMKVMCYKGWV
ncbi:MAG: hypothetical protein Q4D02_01780 [Clostridia bacterium]|nr:hypothetical protein [Clostridia bacterium]